MRKSHIAALAATTTLAVGSLALLGGYNSLYSDQNSADATAEAIAHNMALCKLATDPGQRQGYEEVWHTDKSFDFRLPSNGKPHFWDRFEKQVNVRGGCEITGPASRPKMQIVLAGIKIGKDPERNLMIDAPTATAPIPPARAKPAQYARN